MCQQECENGSLPVHYDAYQCRSPEFSCQALIDSAPNSFSRVDNHGYTPLHWLCNKAQMDEAAAIQILEFLVEKYPSAVWHADNDASLPIHLASRMRSPEFCQVLIGAAPDSIRSIGNYCWSHLHVPRSVAEITLPLLDGLIMIICSKGVSN